ncbi:Nucleotidyltransferase [Abortiporus biennis]|nr:Nucleotidyltransferase [Abortiporus biennis]
MPFKRPKSPTDSLSSQSERDSTPTELPTKRTKLTKALPDISVYIVQAKLDGPAIAELFSLAERHCAKLCKDVEDADVVITAISMRRRLERHIPWEVAKRKAIVTPTWLRDSIQAGHALPCEPYVAIQDLRQSTLENCPDCKKKVCECPESDATDKSSTYPSPISSVNASPEVPAATKTSKLKGKEKERPTTVPIPQYLLPPDPPIPTNTTKLSYKAKYACQRASPLTCLNQGLALELDIIKRSRALEGEDRSALSYSRAISVIKAYLNRITSRRQVEKLPYLGTKILSLIEEYLDTDHIHEAHTISSSERFTALSLFSSVYGIGPHSARRLYALGLRTLDDLEAYYGVDKEELEAESELVQIEKKEEKVYYQKGKYPGEPGKWHGSVASGQADDLGESWVKIALGLREDLSLKIPRDEVEEMGRVVMDELEVIEPGCVYTVVGGYRRGKPESNDVDIVFTHPDTTKVKGLCKRFVKRLYEQGMVSHVMHLSSFHAHNALRTTHWDSLEKALTVFTLPKSSPLYNGTRRRLDLIFAHPEVYWCAVIGWSGSIMFQRDIRQWAKDKCGMKFDSSGITRRRDSKQFFPKTEKEVFDLFGLEWIDPTLRNADV